MGCPVVVRVLIGGCFSFHFVHSKLIDTCGRRLFLFVFVCFCCFLFGLHFRLIACTLGLAMFSHVLVLPCLACWLHPCDYPFAIFLHLYVMYFACMSVSTPYELINVAFHCIIRTSYGPYGRRLLDATSASHFWRDCFHWDHWGLVWSNMSIKYHTIIFIVSDCLFKLNSCVTFTEATRVQQPVKVITGAPVIQQTAAAATPFTANLASAQQFPSLGTQTLRQEVEQNFQALVYITHVYACIM